MRPGKNRNPTEKPRRGFFQRLVFLRRAKSAQALEPHQEFSTTDTTTVSGVVYWLSKDPIGISGGLNQYVFCGNNPVNFTDAFGLCPDVPWWDNVHDYWRNEIDKASDQMIDIAPWPVAGVVNGMMELGMLTIDIPYNLGHFGEGTGAFIADPSTANISGVINDIGTAAGAFGGGIIPGGGTGLGSAVSNLTGALGDIATGVGAGSAVGDLFNGDN